MQLLDDNIVLWAQQLHFPAIDTVMVVITYLGYFWFALPIVYYLIKKQWKAAVTAGVALAVGFLCGNLLLKNLVARPRPYTLLDINLIIPPPGEYSFPSCHALHSFSAATVLYYETRRKYPVIAFGGIVLSCLIAFSRLYIGVHYLTDILAGSALGIGIGAAAIFAVRRLWRENKVNPGK